MKLRTDDIITFRNCLSCVVTARIILLFDNSPAVQNICFIYLHFDIITPSSKRNTLSEAKREQA